MGVCVRAPRTRTHTHTVEIVPLLQQYDKVQLSAADVRHGKWSKAFVTLWRMHPLGHGIVSVNESIIHYYYYYYCCVCVIVQAYEWNENGWAPSVQLCRFDFTNRVCCLYKYIFLSFDSPSRPATPRRRNKPSPPNAGKRISAEW